MGKRNNSRVCLFNDEKKKVKVPKKPMKWAFLGDWAKEIKRQTSSSPMLQARYDYWISFNEYAFNNAAL